MTTQERNTIFGEYMNIIYLHGESPQEHAKNSTHGC